MRRRGCGSPLPAAPSPAHRPSKKICRTVSIADKLVRRSDETPKGSAQTRRQTMRVMMLVKATEGSEQGLAPTPEMLEAFAAMDRFTEALVAAGVIVAGAGLKPSAESKRIAFDGASRSVIDGPFTEARELVAGFSIWEVKDMDEAVAWASRCPNPMSGPSEVEIRPFFEAEDMAEALNLEAPELQGGERGKLGVA